MDRRIFLCLFLVACTATHSGKGEPYYDYDPATLAALPAEEDGEGDATAEQLLAWDVRLMDTVRRFRLPPTVAAKLYADVAVAQRDALLLGAKARGVNAVAAIVACDWIPQSCEELRRVIQASPRELALASIVAGKAHERMLKEQDMKTSPVPPPPGPNVWSDVSATTPDAGSWLPFAKDSTVELPPPPAYGSAQDLSELAAVATAVQDATEWQETRAEFWSGGLGTEAPPGIWLGIAHEALLRHGISDPMKVADLRATLTAAMADSFVNCWRAKFIYWTARPSKRDTAIYPSVPLPLFPSYPSGHSTVSGAASAVLGRAFPADRAMFDAAAREAADSRLWAGIHFPSDNDNGLEAGRETAKKVMEDERFSLGSLR